MEETAGRLQQYLDARRETFVRELLEWLAIPSVSVLPEHRGDCNRAAEWIARRMRAAGMQAELVPSGLPGAHPLVLGRYDASPGRPTVLFYGHYDVQPPDPLAEWKTPPFTPAIVGQDVVARGASDNKGQIWALICAARAMIAVDGRLPVNLRVLIEGEEESGGRSVAWMVQRYPERLRADTVWMADGPLFSRQIPALYTGTRGMVYAEIAVRGARTDLHSGMYGGVAPNPLVALAHILAQLRPWIGRVDLPGFYDAVRAPSDEEAAQWKSLPFDETAFQEEMGVAAMPGEPGFSALERIWARPTFEIHGIRGGFTGDGAKTVIPASASAKVSMRLVPEQDPRHVAESLRTRVAALCPSGVTAEVSILQADPPVQLPIDHPMLRAGAEALEEAFGREPALARMGRTLPALVAISQGLGIPVVMTGFGLPDDRLHAPNEKFHLPNFQRGILATMAFLRRIGATGS